MALQLSLHDDVVLVEVVDSWNPNPEAMPIMLHALDGSVKEVGSTQLLRECVRELRTEQAILDGSANLLVLQEIAELAGGPRAARAADRSFKTKGGVPGDGGEHAVPAQIADGGGVEDGAETARTRRRRSPRRRRRRAPRSVVVVVVVEVNKKIVRVARDGDRV